MNIEENVKATLIFDGLNPSENATTISLSFLQGKISKLEAREQIMKMYLEYNNEVFNE